MHFTTSDANGVLPPDYTFTSNDQGVHVFSNGATLVTVAAGGAGQTITATDKSNSGLTGSSVVTVSASTLSKLGISGTPTSTQAGSPFNFTVQAQDSYGNTITNYTGTVHFTSTDSQAVLPNDTSLSSGSGFFSATLKTAVNQTITATDTSNSGLKGTSSTISVTPGATAQFVVVANPATLIAGASTSISVTAEDAYSNVTPGYTGTVHLTSSNTGAVIPPNNTLTSGHGTFGVTLDTAGPQTVTATDTVAGAINGTSNTITVNPGATTHLAVTANLSTVAAGTNVAFTVSALDTFGNVTPAYTGTVKFAISDPLLTAPANSTLTLGVGTFGVTLKTAGPQTLTATDTNSSALTGTDTVSVTPAATSQFAITGAPTTITAGGSVNFTVTAQDTFGNKTTGYSGTVHFTSTDSHFVSPGNQTLSLGVGTFNVTLKTAGPQTLTASDSVTATITGTSNAITVNPGAPVGLAISAPSGVGNLPFNFTVSAVDSFNNASPSYSGTVHFTSTDGRATLPANSQLINGTGIFSATLATGGVQTLTATDTSNASFTASAVIAVSLSAATHFVVVAPANALAGASFTVTVNALDSNNNTTTGYSGTVHFATSDAQVTVPANTTLINGTGTFTFTLKTSGPQTITATDVAKPSITGGATVSVAAARPPIWPFRSPSPPRRETRFWSLSLPRIPITTPPPATPAPSRSPAATLTRCCLPLKRSRAAWVFSRPLSRPSAPKPWLPPTP